MFFPLCAPASRAHEAYGAAAVKRPFKASRLRGAYICAGMRVEFARLHSRMNRKKIERAAPVKAARAKCAQSISDPAKIGVTYLPQRGAFFHRYEMIRLLFYLSC
jgi:hypothetical protein